MTVQLCAVQDDVVGGEVLVRRTPWVSLIIYNPDHRPTEGVVAAALDLPLLTVEECDFLDSLHPDLPH